MKSRTLVILIALVIAAALLTVVLEREPAPAGDDLTGQRLFPDLAGALNDVSGLEVTAGEDGPTNLRRGETGWVVSERDDYPADAGLIRQLLIRLGEARVVEAKTRNPELYSRLGVADFGADGGGVQVTLQGLPAPVSVVDGNLESRAGTGTYVRPAGGEQSYLVDVSLEPARTPVGWLDRELFDIEPDDVDSIHVLQDDGSELAIERRDGELVVLDVPEGRRLESPTAARSMAGVLRAFKLDDVRPVTDFADEPPAAIAEYAIADGRRLTARLWQQDDGRYAAFRVAYAAPPAAGSDAGAEATDAGEDEGGEDGADEAGDNATGDDSIAAAAAARDERLEPWAFRIPSHKYDLMARRLDDLLAAPEIEPAPAPGNE
jgi:hypothetical protein